MSEDYSNVTVIYHGNCADGFTAAWATRRKFGDAAQYVAGVHMTDPPDVTGRDVVFVDFSYKREVMRKLSFNARSILVLDHHKSASDDLSQETRTGREFCSIIRLDDPEWSAPVTWEYVQQCVWMDRNENIGRAIIYAYFDNDRSGAGIAWDFFNPDEPRPDLVNHVEDRDLWKFKLDGTREIQATVFSYEYTWENWNKLANTHPDTLRIQGVALERKHFKDIRELIAVCKRTMTIGGKEVPVASLPYTMCSDACHIMAEDAPFAASYYDTADGRVFSLRSREGGDDVCEVAKQYGGGGHKNAAGFTVKRDHWLAVQ